MSIPETAVGIASAVRNRECKASDVISRSLDRIRQTQSAINAFTESYDDEALDIAHRIDARIADGDTVGLLAGVPVAVKDFTPLKGKRTTYGSLAYKDNIGTFDPIYVQRLRAAGAIVVGKTNTPEFAHAGFCTNRVFGTTLNPWNTEHTPGGSSGGAGAAVGAHVVPLAEGTDMGGSIRIPAGYCGCVGLKPSLGRIPMDILKSVHDTISHFGPLARTVEDAWAFLNVTKGPDDVDPMSLPAQEIAFDPAGDVRGLKVGLSMDLGFFDVSDEVRAAVDRAATVLRDAGATVEPVDIAWDRSVTDAMMKGWSVYLAAFEGHLLKDNKDLLDPGVAAMFEDAFKTSAPEYKAIETLRRRLWLDLVAVFQGHDALICPTAPITAPLASLTDADFGSETEDGKLMVAEMTHPFNFTAHCPVLSVPCGVGALNLPIGLQVVGRRFDEETVLRIGRAVERGDLMAGYKPQILAA